MGKTKQDNGPLNTLFKGTVVDITDPNGLVTKVTSWKVEDSPEKAAARENLERARAALKEAEEKYHEASCSADKKHVKILNDFYAGKYVLVYDRLVGSGQVIKDNFTITKVEKVIMVGNGFIQVKGKSVKYKAVDKYGIPRDRTSMLNITTETGDNIHLSRADRILDENQLDKLLDRVRKHFFKQMGLIW